MFANPKNRSDVLAMLLTCSKQGEEGSPVTQEFKDFVSLSKGLDLLNSYNNLVRGSTQVRSMIKTTV